MPLLQREDEPRAPAPGRGRAGEYRRRDRLVGGRLRRDHLGRPRRPARWRRRALRAGGAPREGAQAVDAHRVPHPRLQREERPRRRRARRALGPRRVRAQHRDGRAAAEDSARPPRGVRRVDGSARGGEARQPRRGDEELDHARAGRGGARGAAGDARHARPRRRDLHSRPVPAPEQAAHARRADGASRGVRRVAARGHGDGLQVRRERAARALLVQGGGGLPRGVPEGSRRAARHRANGQGRATAPGGARAQRCVATS
mmetsp:Transcript_1107/g.2656  ORF Transcript_1107/g.2656 Transcript_1107/m.2656 type:complete len:259 (+) Transcript_1107:230-1006(+)